MGGLFYFAILILRLVSGGALCPEAIELGELRTFKESKCMDTKGDGNKRKLRIADCDGLDSSIQTVCNDGTIRNGAINFCLTADKDGKGNLYYQPCEVLPQLPDYQKWKLGEEVVEFNEISGIPQVAKMFINVKSGYCLNVRNLHKGRHFRAWPCKDNQYVWFYFRDRGKLLQQGHLRCEISGECVHADGNKKMRNVRTRTCDADSKSQLWSYYENGELVNYDTNNCLDSKGTGKFNSNVLTYACEVKPDQMWDTPEEYSNGDFLGWRNKAEGWCLDTKGKDGSGNILLYTCELVGDQRFQWVPTPWSTPQFNWVQVGCNEEGSLSLQISNDVSYSKSITTEIGFAITAGISGGAEFITGSASATVSSSIAWTWTNSWSESRTTGYTCDFYPNGLPWEGGCMWQLEMETSDVKKNPLLWKAMIVRCTDGSTTPICPPFTKCNDDACVTCYGYPLEGNSTQEGNTKQEL